ncbi:hypothetical protein BZA05DRAFT_120231 [Tricharina praecox]|uniref:uncharacterized protein n=1 Tax=Tricharina praecox TaxID=43433 RepID=UPI002220E6C4|nr:uncharacterized protein BZA05DRAFT_120231 [Tricharina praecox]KAI5848120.1 hypothetical protein BZA05DRAFT_120231 [Tricharina praecox]
MFDCKTTGGHFFVHAPQMRSFNCQRCRTSFPNYNPPLPRTRAAQQWYGALSPGEPDRVKAPWRCIVESCAFIVCEPCSAYAQLELGRLKVEKDKADEEGAMFDFDKELEKLEVDGLIGFYADSKVSQSTTTSTTTKENVKPGKEGFLPGFQDHYDDGDDDGDGTIEVDSKLEVDTNLEADGDDTGYAVEFLRRPFTRSAAAAAASARARARRPTVVKRERDRDRDSTGD